MVDNGSADDHKSVGAETAAGKQAQDLSDLSSRDIVLPSTASMTLRIACFFIISAGVLAITNGLTAASDNEWVNLVNGPDIIRYCGAIVLVLGIGAVLAGFVALVKRRISPAFGGAIMGIAGGGLPGFWLGIFALALLAMSDEDL